MPIQSFLFMRHGQTDWNVKNIYMGGTNIPLNDFGRKQAQEAAHKLTNNTKHSISHIFSSPLLRASETAHIVANILNVSITFLDDLKERGGGILEGQHFENQNHIHQWLNGEITVEKGEELDSFDQRVAQALNEILSFNNRTVEPHYPLIIAHGGVFCSILRLVNMPFHDLANCAPIALAIDTSNAAKLN